MYTIDKGVPLPTKAAASAGTDKYGFARMEVGDSIFVPCDLDEIPSDTRKRVYNAARRYARLNDKKFFAAEDQIGSSQADFTKGARVWRIADPVPAVA